MRALAVLGLGLAFGCGDEGAGPSACEQANDQLRACELEEVDCSQPEQNCAASCLAYLSCEELSQPFEDPGVTACLWHCAPRFECEDGSQIYAAWRCDGEGDCVGGEDEANCEN